MTTAPYSNPTTSYEAARSIEPHINTQQAAVLRYLVANGPATDEAIQAGTGLSQNSERPRRIELERLGLVTDSGQRHQTATGRKAIAWCAVERQAVLL